jgi:fructokinase
MILVCGEALVDFTPVDCGAQRAYAPRPGGSPCNVAVGCARLGAATAFLGGVSTDPFGRLLAEHLESSGVSMSYASRSEAPSPVAFVVLDEHGSADYVFHLADTAMDAATAPADPLPAEIEAVHVGSLGLVLEPAAHVAEDLLRRAHGTRFTSLDPNVRRSFVPDLDDYVRRLDGWLSATDLVKVSEEDLRTLHPDEEPLAVAGRWVRQGPALVVVTRGAMGAVAVSADTSVEIPGTAVEVVDTVGAGDAFTAGLLSWLDDHDALSRGALADLDRVAVTQALRFAATVAARTCERPGADPPTRTALESG